MALRHKHADVIHAWAEGEEIEFRGLDMDCWLPLKHTHPVWFEMTEYRIKPKTVKREGWVNVYDYHDASIWSSKEEADSRANAWRKACIRIEWEEEQ